MNHVTLDGVMQAPGRPDEDNRDGFAYGGWGAAGNDEVMGRFISQRMAVREQGALLFGKRTYEDVLSYWNGQPDNPFAPVLNQAQKYVASKTLEEPLAWPNSALLQGDAVDAIAKLKQEQPETRFSIMGSRTLCQGLMARDLIDEWLLMIHPLVLGTGLRLFGDSAQATRLRLVDSLVSTTGVIIATYHPTTEPIQVESDLDRLQLTESPNEP